MITTIMNKKIVSLIVCLLIAFPNFGQDDHFTESLFSSYDIYREASLDHRRIKHRDLQPLIKKLSGNPQFQVNKVGESIEGRDLSLISIGSGETDVFLWSQMHGDEP